MSVILGIHEAHDASAALMIDGKIVAAAQEERFSGLKGDYGLPVESVRFCMKVAGIEAAQIDTVALCSHAWNPVLTKVKRNANFSVDDWVKEQRSYWYPTMFENKRVNYYNLYKDRSDFRYDDVYPMDHLLEGYMDSNEMEEMTRLRRSTVADLLGISTDIITTVTHEDCHTFYSYFASPLRGEVLALTAEGIGDYSNGTVSRMDETGRKELAHTRHNHLGHIYQYITLLLGMKPAQHEYKVMGMAPYANIKEVEKSYEVFENILKVNGLNIEFDQKPRDLYFHFRDALEGHRFDGISGALQQFTEEILAKWVKACIKETGLKRVCFSGGVAQNIKADKVLMELEEVEDIFVCPAAGDSSLSLGACYYSMWKHLSETGGDTSLMQPMAHVYLGPEYTADETEKVLKEKGAFDRYRVTLDVSPETVAKKLAQGMIIARSCGPMEFGLRALGNRSIMADPRNNDTIRRINQAIKFRDFWMPFTPSMLADRAADYLVNPKGCQSPFMTMAFESTPLCRKDLIAALHPADFTVRPQLLEEKANPDYYAIIKAFERETGVGGILNTSFNLHGSPIALGPEEALYTFENSDLDGLLVNGILVERS